MKQNELFLEYFPSTIITESLSAIRDATRTNIKLARAIRELVKNRKNNSLDDGKQYYFERDGNST
ncbi:LAQU0S03e04786g1_1 [Lachancea quebecensis]|uniref:LAQU0S03e04786g1_1 n=1 Tax=Lachancea quebecensis TaxID=1654605 RepID=A0A0P1KPQ2_9SACH|nr:LAQU0S03e04786g1_1 [Lachancea quebecensis]